MEENQLYPNFIQAIWLMCIFFIGSIIFVFISRYLQIMEGTVVYTIVKNLSSIFLYSFPLYYALKKKNITFRQILGDSKGTKYYVLPAIIIIIGFKYILLPMEYFLKYFLYGITELSLENTIIDLIDMPLSIIIAPIFEELLFRGLILKSFLKRYSVIKSILLSSVLFGVMHISPTAILNATIISIIISYLYIKTKSVWICIIAHSIANTMSIGYLDYILMHYLHFNFSTYVITGILFAVTGLHLLNKAYSCTHKGPMSTTVE